MTGSGKLVLIGVAAVGVLTLAALAVLSRLDLDPLVTGRPAEAAPAAAPLPAAALPPPAAVEPPRPEFQASPPPATTPQAPLAAELRNEWDTVPIVGRGRTGFARGLQEAVAELQPLVADCYDKRVQAQQGGAAVTEYTGQDAGDQLPEPTLLLLIEARRADLLVLDAPVEWRGEAPAAVLACAQARVKGKTLLAEGAKPGARFKVRLPVSP